MKKKGLNMYAYLQERGINYDLARIYFSIRKTFSPHLKAKDAIKIARNSHEMASSLFWETKQKLYFKY